MIGLSAGMPNEKIISNSEILTKIRADQSLECDNYVIKGDLCLSWLEVNGYIRFSRTTFDGNVSCFDSKFE
jgi:hypothetical protein